MPPESDRLRPWPLIGIGAVILLLGAGTVVVLLLANGNQDLINNTVSIATGLAATAISGFIAWLWRRRRWQDANTPATLADAADSLADAVFDQWKNEAGDRKLRGHVPVIPVRWEWSKRPVAGRVDEAIGREDHPGIGRFAPLPGMQAATEDTVRAGGLAELFAVYAGLASGRIVVLGEPGAGKSAAAILTLLKALDHRKAIEDQEARARVPVPVLLTLRGWDPQKQPLGDWLAARLAADLRFLRAGTYGPEVVNRLLSQRRIALFLDGFDEMADSARAVALQAIDQQTDVRIVLLTRTGEFTEAVRTGRLHGAAALEMRPVPVGTAADYLERCQVDPAPPEWAALVSRVREEPDGPLAQALASPLAVTLVRDTFPEPAELADLLAPANGFSSRQDVDDYLLDRVLPVAYQDRPGRPAPYNLGQARRWLSYLARQMAEGDTKDLAWWRLADWAPAYWRMVLTTLVCGVVGGLAGAVVAWLTDEFAERETAGAIPGVVVGLLAGFAIALAVERQSALAIGGARSNFGMGMVAALAVGIAALLTIGPALGGFPAITVGLGAALAAGIATAIASGVGITRRRFGTFRSGFVNGLPTGLATGVPAGLATGVPTAIAHGVPDGVGIGLTTGLAFLLAFALIDGIASGGLDSANSVDPVTAWRQDFRRAVLVGLVFGFAVGFAAGVTDAMATIQHDTFLIAAGAGAITALALGTATGLGATLTVSGIWRTMLAFTQLRVRNNLPLRGMRFLDNAHQLEVLRAVGPVYQFRHARLQDRLARTDDS